MKNSILLAVFFWALGGLTVSCSKDLGHSQDNCYVGRVFKPVWYLQRQFEEGPFAFVVIEEALSPNPEIPVLSYVCFYKSDLPEENYEMDSQVHFNVLNYEAIRGNSQKYPNVPSGIQYFCDVEPFIRR